MGKSDKEHILGVIECLKNQRHPKNISAVCEDYKLLSNEKQEHLKKILIEEGLVQLADNNHSRMKLTARSIILDPNDLDDNGNFIKDKLVSIQKDEIHELQIENLELQNRGLKRKIPYGIFGFIGGVILTLLGSFVPYILSKQQSPQTEIMQLQISTSQAAIDTVYIISDTTSIN